MESVAKEIIENLGGFANITKIENCVTRLRISVKSIDDVNIPGIKNLDEVLNILVGETVQIIVGPGKSRKLAKIITNLDSICHTEEPIMDCSKSFHETFQLCEEKIKKNHFLKKLVKKVIKAN